MTSVIGFGRRAREVYPEGGHSGGAGALVRVGYDGVVEEFEIPIPSESNYLPKNSALDPIQVTFPSFTLGDTLEVDFKLNGFWESETTGLENITTRVVISLDGGATFYTLTPSTASDKADSGEDNIVYLRSLDAITIVDPMPVVVGGVPGTIPVTAPPIVRVVYNYGGADGAILVNGGTDEIDLPGAILKCTELAASAVFQGPLGQLVTP